MEILKSRFNKVISKISSILFHKKIVRRDFKIMIANNRRNEKSCLRWQWTRLTCSLGFIFILVAIIRYGNCNLDMLIANICSNIQFFRENVVVIVIL